MIDLRAAYSHVDRNMLFSVVDICTKAPKLTSILKSLYTGTKAAIKNTVDSFQVHTGCRQGGIESPLQHIYIYGFRTAVCGTRSTIEVPRNWIKIFVSH